MIKKCLILKHLISHWRHQINTECDPDVKNKTKHWAETFCFSLKSSPVDQGNHYNHSVPVKFLLNDPKARWKLLSPSAGEERTVCLFVWGVTHFSMLKFRAALLLTLIDDQLVNSLLRKTLAPCSKLAMAFCCESLCRPLVEGQGFAGCFV